jgi:hypothetical protein
MQRADDDAAVGRVRAEDGMGVVMAAVEEEVNGGGFAADR